MERLTTQSTRPPGSCYLVGICRNHFLKQLFSCLILSLPNTYNCPTITVGENKGPNWKQNTHAQERLDFGAQTWFAVYCDLQCQSYFGKKNQTKERLLTEKILHSLYRLISARFKTSKKTGAIIVINIITHIHMFMLVCIYSIILYTICVIIWVCVLVLRSLAQLCAWSIIVWSTCWAV